MVVVIHKNKNTIAAFEYNEKKVEEGHAHFFHSRNANAANAFVCLKELRLQVLQNIENKNSNVNNKCLHISVNPTPSDLDKMSSADLREEMENLMKKLGYGNQPFFIYKHADIQRTHFHIVSSRIDANSFKKIKDSNEKRKTNQFIKELEQKYNLEHHQKKSQSINLIPNANSPNLVRSVQEVLKSLNRSNISSKQEYLDILKAFNLEIHNGDKGQYVCIKDLQGKTLRHPINMSDFQEKGLLTFDKIVDREVETALKHKTQRVLKALNNNYRFYTEKELRNAFFKNELIPYKISKNGNYNIYSPIQRTVVNAQELMKRYSVRLKDFVLTNDQFYAIVKDYTDQLTFRNKEISEVLIDRDKTYINGDSRTNKVYIKDQDFSGCEEFNTVTSNMDNKAINDVKHALQDHFEYLLNQANNRPLRQPSNSYQKQSISYSERLSRLFLFEMANYWRQGNYKHRYEMEKVRKRNQTKRRGIRY